MVRVNRVEFQRFVAEAIDSLPRRYIDNLSNVAIVVEDNPSAEQRKKLKLCQGSLLFGLYEGIPLTRRTSSYTMVLPDKITIFKRPIESISSDIDELKQRIRHTIWHEIAHHFGLDHKRIHELEYGAIRKKDRLDK